MNRFITDTKKYWKYSIYSAKSQLKTEVANSYLNWIWWILEPFCLMLVYSFVFGFLFQRKIDHFNTFIFCGLTVWQFFNSCVKSSVKIVKRNKPIVSKVYLPKHILLISDMMVQGFKTLIQFAIVFLMLAVYRIRIDWHVILLLPVLFVLVVVTFAVSSILLNLGVFVEDMGNVVTILLRLGFYMSGIMYSIEDGIPAPYNRIMLEFNPMAMLITGARKCLMYASAPSWKILLVWFVLGTVVAWIGVHNIYKNENTYAKVI